MAESAQTEVFPSEGRELSPRLLAGKAGASLLRRRSRHSGRPVGLVLVHHEIAPTQGDPERDIVPAQGTSLFKAQLEHLGRHYEVVPLRELVAHARERRPGHRIPVALTFDDDLSCHASIVAPMLESFGFPATFFLNGNTLDGPSPFWWQDLQAIANRGPGAWDEMRRILADDWPWAGLDGRVSDLANTIEAAPPNQRDAVAARLRELAGPDPLDEGLPAPEVKSLVEGGFEIGVHTLRHYSLPTLDAKRLDQAMREGVDELEKVIGYRPTSIGYPHGKADLRVAEAAQRAGFQLGAICAHNAAGPEQHPMLVDRITSWTGSLASFAWALGRLARAG